jgi:hypothetical protein
VSAWWRQKSGVRGLIGFLASQIIALQFLLTGIVATEMAVRASADAFVICHGNNQSPSGQPGSYVNHATCAICAFAAHAPLVPPDTSHVAILDVLTSVVANVTPLAIATSERHSPRTSQGPPLSA